jgi:hypothetical protein
LVPICSTLHQWLEPLKMRSGHILEFKSYTPFDRSRAQYCKSGMSLHGRKRVFTWKNNALRHSYASYRLAELKDAARVALEMGNSPSMLFRNYRELVTEQEAQAWFALTPEKVKEPNEQASS